MHRAIPWGVRSAYAFEYLEAGRAPVHWSLLRFGRTVCGPSRGEVGWFRVMGEAPTLHDSRPATRLRIATACGTIFSPFTAIFDHLFGDGRARNCRWINASTVFALCLHRLKMAKTVKTVPHRPEAYFTGSLTNATLLRPALEASASISAIARRVLVGAEIDLGLRPLLAGLDELRQCVLARQPLAVPEQRPPIDGRFDFSGFGCRPSSSPWQVELDGVGEQGRGDDEDHQHQHDVDQRHHVDLGHRLGRGFAVSLRKPWRFSSSSARWTRPCWAAGCGRPHVGERPIDRKVRARGGASAGSARDWSRSPSCSHDRAADGKADAGHDSASPTGWPPCRAPIGRRCHQGVMGAPHVPNRPTNGAVARGAQHGEPFSATSSPRRAPS